MSENTKTREEIFAESLASDAPIEGGSIGNSQPVSTDTQNEPTKTDVTPATEQIQTEPKPAEAVKPGEITESDLLGGTSSAESPSLVNPNPPATPVEPEKRRGRPPIHGRYSKKKNADGSVSVINEPDETTAVEKLAEEKHKLAASVIFDSATGTLQGFLGDEWKPDNSEERARMIEGIAKYLEATNAVDIPPGVFLLLLTASYVGPRFTRPKTQSKIMAGFAWIKSKLGFK